MDDAELKRLHDAVERKKHDSERASRHESEQPPQGGSGGPGEQPPLTERGRTQDTRDERKKSTGHRKHTADKWNQ